MKKKTTTYIEDGSRAKTRSRAEIQAKTATDANKASAAANAKSAGKATRTPLYRSTKATRTPLHRSTSETNPVTTAKPKKPQATTQTRATRTYKRK